VIRAASGNLLANHSSQRSQTLSTHPHPDPSPTESAPAETPSTSQNWKLTLAYDGTDFHGWQIQPGHLTVQGELQAALGRVTGESPLPQGSGRTDAGVHALAQVASFGLEAAIPADNLRRALNRTLPSSIRVLEAKVVPPEFHARHSTVAKTYEYRVFLERAAGPELPRVDCSPFLARYVLSYPWPLDLGRMQEAADVFVGRHDFTSFAATDPDLDTRTDEDTRSDALGSGSPENDGSKINPVRTIFGSRWSERSSAEGKLLVYQVRGSGFLHHMVRNLVGTMLDVGRGYRQAGEVQGMLAARARAAAGPTAPARGLFLHSVEYHPDREG
jgi:tRNA pseudouridine38-40 synthase